MDDIINKVDFLDGMEIPICRVMSVPSIFNLNINKENCLGIEGGFANALQTVTGSF